MVYFNCDLGYDLVGSPDRKCLLNGTWTGTQPVCKGVVCRMSDVIRMQHKQNLIDSFLDIIKTEIPTVPGTYVL